MIGDTRDSEEMIELVSTEDSEDLKPKPPPKLAPRGIRTWRADNL